MISVDELTAPLPGADPCGEDLSAGSSLLELDSLLLGKAETQFSTGEPPDWRKVRETCLALFVRSRDLRVSVVLCLALLCTDGMSGLCDGLKVLRQLLEKYWLTLHPKLDPEDNNDPLQRMNTISVLGASIGKEGDPYRFIERLEAVPLTNSRQMGRFGFGAIVESREATAKGAPPALDVAHIEAAFRDTPALELQLSYENTVGALAELQAIEGLLRSAAGAANAPSLTALTKSLTQVRELLEPYVQSTAISTSRAPTGSPANLRLAGQNGTGPISSRDDVLRALAEVREFYAQHEPASPIPLLVHRIERMVPMTFLELLQEMAPDSINQVSTIVGPQNESIPK